MSLPLPRPAPFGLRTGERRRVEPTRVTIVRASRRLRAYLSALGSKALRRLSERDGDLDDTAW